MHVERSADKAHRCGARAVLIEAALPGVDYLRLIGQPEIVVARKHDDVAGLFHVHFGRHRRRQVAQVFVRSGLFERVEVALQLRFERLIHGFAMSPLKSSTILAASPLLIKFEGALELACREARA